MSDHKSQLLQQAEIAFSQIMSDEDRATAIDALTAILADYNVTKAVTDLVAYEGINEALIKQYCACLLIEGKSKNTVREYKRRIEDLCRTVHKPCSQMNAFDIRYYLAEKKQTGVENRTLENYRANLSAFFQWLTKEDLIQKNPCANIQPIKYIDKVRLPFSSVEIDSLRFACDNDFDRAMIEVFLSTGVRVSELIALKVSDIDFNNKSVHVRNGKGGKERTVYMSDLARAHLQTYLSKRGSFADVLFINRYGQPFNSRRSIAMRLDKLSERSGVDNVHPHRFRRTFATGLASRGMDIQEIKKLLGHSNINTTLEYVYTSDEQVKASYEKFIA